MKKKDISSDILVVVDLKESVGWIVEYKNYFHFFIKMITV